MMTLPQQVVEGNKLIARFLGYEYYPHNHPEINKPIDAGWKTHPKASPFTKLNATESLLSKIRYDYLCRHHNGLAFHSDWNQLMRVIDKIEELGHSTNIDSDVRELINDKYYCGILYKDAIGTYIAQQYSRTSKMDAVWNCVIQFIQWYNSKK